jgi:aminopeptidase N
MGAMENAACVTFNDAYVFKEEVDSARVTYLAVVISHEMAHHWFGNLVTMKWWNDLWLNESFAQYISSFNLSKCDLKVKYSLNKDIFYDIIILDQKNLKCLVGFPRV